LRDIQRDLGAEGLGLKIFDGYRPYGITERMWEPIRNPNGSRHNRGRGRRSHADRAADRRR